MDGGAGRPKRPAGEAPRPPPEPPEPPPVDAGDRRPLDQVAASGSSSAPSTSSFQAAGPRQFRHLVSADGHRVNSPPTHPPPAPPPAPPPPPFTSAGPFTDWRSVSTGLLRSTGLCQVEPWSTGFLLGFFRFDFVLFYGLMMTRALTHLVDFAVDVDASVSCFFLSFFRSLFLCVVGTKFFRFCWTFPSQRTHLQ